MHDLTHILSDKDRRRELRREAEMDRLAAEAREGRDDQPANREPNTGGTRRSSDQYDRETPDPEKGPS